MTERLKELIDYGVSLGYKEDTLREVVKTQQEIERGERRAETEKQKDKLEYQRQKEKYTSASNAPTANRVAAGEM